MKKIIFTLIIILRLSLISLWLNFLLLIPIWSGQVAQAQVQQEWVRRYPDTNTFSAISYALALDDSDNVYITGHVDFNNNPPYNGYCTIKYNSSGVQQWVSNYYGNNSGGRYAYAIALDSSSNVYVTGYSYQSGTYFDYCTIKYNSDGVQQWVQYYDGPGHGIDQAQKVEVDNAGNVYVTGFSSIGGNNFVYTTIKYSTDGRQLWVRSYGVGGGNTYANGIAVDDSCNVYITGENNSVSTTYTNAVTIKYDSSGNQRWVQTYSGLGIGGETAAKTIALDKNNNVYIAGFTKGSISSYDYDCFTIKYTSSGVQQWERRYNTDSTVYSYYLANSMVTEKTGNVYIAGYFTPDYNVIPAKFCIIKYSITGELLWVQKDSAQITEGGPFIDIDKGNRVYLTGSTIAQPSNTSILTMKYDSSGVKLWNQEYNEASNSYPNSLKVDSNLNIFITGVSDNNMCTIKYSQPVGVKNEHNKTPQLYKLFQNYPNPFNSETYITYDLPAISYVQLTIYDVLGKKVKVLFNSIQKAGTHVVKWDAANISSGIYFYSISIFNEKLELIFKDSKKMLLIK